MMEGQAKGARGSGRAESGDIQAAPPTVNHAPRRRRFSVDLSSWGRKIGQLPAHHNPRATAARRSDPCDRMQMFNGLSDD